MKATSHPRNAAMLLGLVASPLLGQSARNGMLASNLPDAPSTTQQPQETQAQRTAREQREEAANEVKAQEKQRIGGVLPNFNVVISGHAARLSSKQKFSIALHSLSDPYTIAISIVGAGYGEIDDDHSGYGHGPGGFFKRVGSGYADEVSGTLIGNAILPSLLHQDPRYFRKGVGTIKSRIIYSALTSFICYGDNGKRQFNTSNVLGNFLAGGLSNAYYPADERGIGLTIENGSYDTALGMVGAQLLEFSPDVTNYIHRRRQAARDRKAAAHAAAQAARATPQPQP